jgi:sec-independent protein translocase protein TatA
VVNVGPLEIMLVAIIALIVLGPARLPEVARSVGRGMREFRSALNSAGDDDSDDELDDEIPGPDDEIPGPDDEPEEKPDQAPEPDEPDEPAPGTPEELPERG